MLEPSFPPGSIGAQSTRRSILRNIGVVAAVAAVPSMSPPTPASAFGEPGRHDVYAEELWVQRAEVRVALTQVEKAIDDAQARLPWWAAPGPKWLRADGGVEGPVTTMPAIVDLAPPRLPGLCRLLRPSREDVLEDIQRWAVISPGSDAARSTQALDAWDRRRAAQLRERDRVGLPALEDQLEPLVDRCCDCEDAIERLVPLSPTILAAQLMIEGCRECELSRHPSTSDLFFYGWRRLQALRPYLTGSIRADVDEMVEDRQRPLVELRAYAGSEARDV